MVWDAEDLGEKRLIAVIIIAFPSLRVNFAKHPDSSHGSAKRVTAGVRLPKYGLRLTAPASISAACKASIDSFPSTQHPAPSPQL